MRILAVDDDPVVLDLIGVIFEQTELHEVSLATCGHDALRRLRDPDAEFDCVLLDISMPDMSGIEVCHQIRTLAWHRDTPVIMLTSHTEPSAIKEAFSAGATDYITKPFEIKNVIDRVQVAERMCQTDNDVMTFNTLDMAAGTEAGAHAFTVDQPICISDAAQMIKPFCLGNYISQLSRRDVNDCHVFAIAIADIEDLYESCSSREFAIALSEVSDTISQLIGNSRLLTSYFGDGLLLCVTTENVNALWPQIEKALQQGIARSAAAYDDGRAIELKLSIGYPLRPNASLTKRVKPTFDRAISRTQRRIREVASMR